MIKVINLHKTRLTDFVYIGRDVPFMKGSIIANPTIIYRDEDRIAIFAEYRKWLEDEIRKKDVVYRYLLSLQLTAMQKDLNLGCWCKPKKCHGDVIKHILERGIDG
jgi:hypothetical protein